MSTKAAFTSLAVAGSSLNRGRLIVAADALAAAVAISLPWSTTATGILVALWLLALVPTLDAASMQSELRTPAGYMPVAFWALAVAGMLWSDASWAERLHGLSPFHRLLAIPLLLVQFRRSGNWQWMASGFILSCTVLLAASFVHAALWGRVPWVTGVPGVPAKDYITQSGVFELCILGAAYAATDAWQAGRRGFAFVLLALCLAFLVDIAYVTTSRTTLVTLPVLIVLFGLMRLGARGTVILVGAGVIGAALIWVSSPYARLRVNNAFAEVALYRATDAMTSSGLRVEFWRKSVRFIAQAPVIGHGTGSIPDLFRQAAAPGSGASSIATTNPHEQILTVAIQLGMVGVVALLLFWLSHVMLFIAPGLAAWCGLSVVLQNAISSLFNSHLLDFTQGWIYVFGVGVLGGAVRRGRAETAPGGSGLGPPDPSVAENLALSSGDNLASPRTAAAPPLPSSPRILIITLRRLGDVLLTTSLIRALREGRPASTIHALVFRGTEGILAGNPDLDAVFTISQRPSVLEFVRTAAGLWRSYDVAVCTQTGDRPMFLAFAAGRLRVGFGCERDNGFWWKRWLMQRRVAVNPENHRVSELMRLAARLDLSGPARVVCPQGASEIAVPEPYAVVHASPMFRYRRWTDDGWRRLVRGLCDRGLAVVATGGADPAECAYLDELFEPVARSVNRVDGKLDWPQLAALLRGARVYIGPDTSMTHLAAASGCPTVGLYGPASPRGIGPWPVEGLAQPWEHRAPVQQRGNVWVVQEPLACLPCDRVGCEGHVDSFSRCLDQLAVGRVLAAVDAALGSSRSRRTAPAAASRAPSPALAADGSVGLQTRISRPGHTAGSDLPPARQ